MEMPVNFLTWAAAFLPIVVLVLLMVKFKWGATEAAPIGLLITVITGLTLYKADFTVLAAEAGKGIWYSLIILLIVWTAILLYQVGDEAKAFVAIKNGMSKLLPNELLLILSIGWIFVSFLQGITGFGVPVAVCAPLLIGIGVKPKYAVVISLLGQTWGNTFGTLAASWDALAMSANLVVGSPEYLSTALWAATFIMIWNFITGFAICFFYGGLKALQKSFLAVIILGVIHGFGEMLLTQVNTTLSCFIPAVISLVVILLLGKTKFYGDEWRIEESPIMDRSAKTDEEAKSVNDMSLVQAFVPYVILSALTMIVLTVKPLNSFLASFSFGLAFPETVTGYGFVNHGSSSYSPLAPFTHASMFLFISAMVGFYYYSMNGWIKKGGMKRIFGKSVVMTMPSGIAVVGLVIMSKIMSGTGQTHVLAEGISGVLGNYYVVLAPFVGLLGSFMTGSNMSSNILFGDFQLTTSKLLGLNPASVLGAQTAGGAIGSALSPSKIILGTTTANIFGKEGEVLKTMMGITIVTAIAIGLGLFFMIAL